MSEADPSGEANQSGERHGPRWRVIVGVLGLVYGVCGTLMWLLATVSSLFWKQFMAMAGMGNLEMPAPLFWNGIVSSFILLVLGLMLALGSGLLIARRPRGATLMRTWAALRILMVVVGLVAGFLTMPMQVDFQMTIVEAQRDMLRQRNVPEDQWPKADRAKAEAWIRYSMGGMAVLFAAFPLFVGLVLTSRAKKDEIESWASLPR
ncbi:MAG: hypothetical protein U0572_12810 [Phycisphaerales bacterium]